MRLKLADIEINPHEEEVGTYELCTSVEMVNEPVSVLRKDNGGLVHVKIFIWGWGFYGEKNTENVVDFATYISEQEFDEE